MNKHNTTPIHKIRKIALSALLISSLTLSFASTTWAAASKIYEYDINGRLSTTYTMTEKTTFTYDTNGNLLRKHVEKGDYSSKVNPAGTIAKATSVSTNVSTESFDTPSIAENGTDTSLLDPSITPPPLSIPSKQDLPIRSKLHRVIYQQATATIQVKGWYLDPVGIAQVQIHVDGVDVGRANMGSARSDVNQVYPDYNNPLAGFDQQGIEIVTKGLPHKEKDKVTGKMKIIADSFDHKIKVVIVNQKGEKTTINQVLTVYLNR